jgi:hypothetical protein
MNLARINISDLIVLTVLDEECHLGNSSLCTYLCSPHSLFHVKIFSTLCSRHSTVYLEYRGLFPRGYSGRGVKLTAHPQLVPR